jgi:ankyrin repeat protein
MDSDDDIFEDPDPSGDEGHTHPGRDDRPEPTRVGRSAYYLWKAAGNCNVDRVKSELETGGIDIEQALGEYHTTALFQAVSCHQTRVHPAKSMEIASILIHAGADPLARSAYRMTPLHAVLENCMGTNILRMILHEHPNLDLNVRESSGRTPLLSSIYFSDSNSPVTDDIIALLEHGADPRIPDSDGNTILHWCTNKSILDRVLHGPLGVDINARNQNGQTPIFLKIYRQDNYLEQFEDVYNEIRSLLERGADARIPNNQGNTIFHLPLDEPTTLLILSGHFHIDINARNNRGQTALHIAVEDNSYERVCLLLRIGVDLDIRDSNGETAEEFERSAHPLENTAILGELSRRRIERALAIAMATHRRLGDESWLGNIEPELMRNIYQMSRKPM